MIPFYLVLALGAALPEDEAAAEPWPAIPVVEAPRWMVVAEPAEVVTLEAVGVDHRMEPPAWRGPGVSEWENAKRWRPAGRWEQIGGPNRVTAGRHRPAACGSRGPRSGQGKFSPNRSPTPH